MLDISKGRIVMLFRLDYLSLKSYMSWIRSVTIVRIELGKFDG